jgi:phosphohistidine phosphatase SixA
MFMHRSAIRIFSAAAFCAYSLLLGSLAVAQAPQAHMLSGQALVDALRQGGYVIVMRHAHSPRTPPDAEHAAPANTRHERELDEEGRATATAMGNALKRLGIPIAEVLSSPTFRALQTVRLLGLEPTPTPELGDGGRDMKADSEGTRSAWLRTRAAMKPPAGGNTLMVTHLPNLVGAFGDAAANTGDGEALVVRPDGTQPMIVGRIRIDEWPRLSGN